MEDIDRIVEILRKSDFDTVRAELDGLNGYIRPVLDRVTGNFAAYLSSAAVLICKKHGWMPDEFTEALERRIINSRIGRHL